VRYTASNAARFAGIWERNNLIGESNAEAGIDTTD
ncbi:TPA: tyrosine recombinase, partial [Klebsiella quasipneumoniae]